MMELGITQPTNIHNMRSLIRTLIYAWDILHTEEAFMVKEYTWFSIGVNRITNNS